MNENELKKFIVENETDISWKRPEEDMNSLFLHSARWNETIKIDINSLSKITKEGILMMLCGGKNIEQMTRVTGYFSKIAGWNKGKTGELKERHRINSMGIRRVNKK